MGGFPKPPVVPLPPRSRRTPSWLWCQLSGCSHSQCLCPSSSASGSPALALLHRCSRPTTGKSSVVSAKQPKMPGWCCAACPRLLRSWQGRAGQQGTPGWRGSQRKEAAASLGGDRKKSGGSPAQTEQRQRLVPVRGRGTGAERSSPGFQGQAGQEGTGTGREGMPPAAGQPGSGGVGTGEGMGGSEAGREGRDGKSEA